MYLIFSIVKTKLTMKNERLYKRLLNLSQQQRINIFRSFFYNQSKLKERDFSKLQQFINFQYKMNYLSQARLFFLILLIFVTQCCLNINQKDGECTQCVSTELFQKGFCNIKIRGCLNQSMTICQKCQKGYILTKNTCIRQAQFWNLTNLAPAPQIVQSQILNASQITPIRVGGYKDTTDFSSELYLQAKKTLQKEYTFLSGLKTYKIQEQLVNGMNYMFYFINLQNYDLYLARVYINFQMVPTVEEIYKNDASIKKGELPPVATAQVPGGWRQFTNISDPRYQECRTLVSNTFTGLQQYKLDRVEYQIVAGINFLLYFVNQTYNQKFIVKIYKPFWGKAVIMSKWGLTPAQVIKANQSANKDAEASPAAGQFVGFSIENYDKEPFMSVKATIRTVFTEFQNSMIKKVEEQIVAGFNYIVTFSYTNSQDIFQVRIFVPLPYTGQDPQIEYIKKNGVEFTPQAPEKIPAAGSFEGMTAQDLNNEPFLSVKQKIRTVFPDFQNSMIKKAKQQVVAGFNYLVTFSYPNSQDEYQIRVFVPLGYTGLGPEIDYLKKNGVQIDPQYVIPASQTATNNQASSNSPSTSTSSTKTITMNSSASNLPTNITPSKIAPIYNYQTDSIFTELYNFFKAEVNITNIPPIALVQREQKILGVNSSFVFFEYKIIYSTLQYATCRHYPDYNIFQVVSYMADNTEIYRLGQRFNALMYDRTEQVLVEKIKTSDQTKFARLIVQQITQIKLSQAYRIYRINGFTSAGNYEITILDKGQLFIVKVSQLNKGTCYSIKVNQAIEYRQQYIIDQIKTFLFTKYTLSGYELTLAVFNSYANESSKYVILLSRGDFKKIKVQVEQNEDKFIIKTIQTLNDGLYLIPEGNLTKNLQQMARRAYSSELQGFDLSFTLSNSSTKMVKLANSQMVATFIKIAQSDLSQIKKQAFQSAVPCAVAQTGPPQICQKCAQNNYLWKGKCFRKVANCAVQIGSICGVCDKFSISLNGKCLKNCSDIFSL